MGEPLNVAHSRKCPDHWCRQLTIQLTGLSSIPPGSSGRHSLGSEYPQSLLPWPATKLFQNQPLLLQWRFLVVASPGWLVALSCSRVASFQLGVSKRQLLDVLILFHKGVYGEQLCKW